MIELHLDTTQAKIARVEIKKDGKILIAQTGASPLPTIVKALDQTGLNLKNIDTLTSNPGPGSFTGIRIGAAVVNALNLALGKNAPLIKPVYN